MKREIVGYVVYDLTGVKSGYGPLALEEDASKSGFCFWIDGWGTLFRSCKMARAWIRKSQTWEQTRRLGNNSFAEVWKSNYQIKPVVWYQPSKKAARKERKEKE